MEPDQPRQVSELDPPLFTKRRLKAIGFLVALVAILLNLISSGGVLEAGGHAAKWVAILLGFATSAQAILHGMEGTTKPAP